MDSAGGSRRIEADAANGFADAALRIGRRLAGQAVWEGDACAWLDPARPEAPPRSSFYHGSAGVALFLAELAAVTRDETVTRAALGGVAHALGAGEAYPPASASLHDGRVGVAFAAVRAGELLARPGLFARAEALLRPLAGEEANERGLDVIGGAAGAVPALLRMAGRVDPELAYALARARGDHLVRTAVREPAGWSWNTVPRGTAVRNPCGYAHGGSGVAHALLELYAATGEGAYRYAAEQAMLYERRFFVPEQGNWLDLRVMDMVLAMHDGGLPRLRERLLAGEAGPRWTPGCSVAWCHGAPGIARTRLRAYELLGDAQWLSEARTAVATTRASPGESLGCSLCHGLFGNADTLLHAADTLGEPQLALTAAQLAAAAVSRYEDVGEPWPCSTDHPGPVPGLLLGEAGIGLFLLRLARADVPSPLFVTGPGFPRQAVVTPGAAGYDALRDETVERAVGRTLRRLRALGVRGTVVPRREMGQALRSDADAAVEAVAACVAAEPDPSRRALFHDAFRVDRAAHALAGEPADDCRAFLYELVRPPVDAVPWADARLVLAYDTRLVSTEWDWDGWMGDAEGAAPATPVEEQRDFVIQRRAGIVAVHPVAPFAAMVLEALSGGASVAGVAARVAEFVDAPVDALREPVLAQLRAAYQRELVELAAEPGGSIIPAGTEMSELSPA
jgi:hypothetical protein